MQTAFQKAIEDLKTSIAHMRDISIVLSNPVMARGANGEIDVLNFPYFDSMVSEDIIAKSIKGSVKSLLRDCRKLLNAAIDPDNSEIKVTEEKFTKMVDRHMSRIAPRLVRFKSHPIYLRRIATT